MKEVKKFTGFTRETEEFLWGISLNNERGWFLEHKQQYLDSLYEPMKALTHEVWQRLEGVLSMSTVSRCSRIYRDARRLRGRGPYKDRMWFTVSTSLQWVQEPVFYFEISPQGAEYGMGCYDMTPQSLERMRAVIDSEPAKAQRLMDGIIEDGLFSIYGRDYKVPKGVFDSSVDMLYNKRNFGFSRNMKWGRELTAVNLPGKLAKQFKTLVPMFEYMMTFIPQREE